MRRFRFHIGRLVILVVLLGVGFAALREADDLWDSIVLTAAVGVLLVSILLAVHRQVEKRAFWVGFALFGWGYVGLTLLPAIEPRLLTTRALTYLDSQVPGRVVIFTDQLVVEGGPNPRTPVTLSFSTQTKSVAASPNSRAAWLYQTLVNGRVLGSGRGSTENFVRIGHALSALILAWLGGNLSRRLQVRNREVLPGLGQT